MNTAINIFPEKCAYKYFLLIVFIGDKMEESLNVPQTNQNPLSQWYRQPKIYVKLPSQGQFYPKGALDLSSNEEYAVYAMTAKDELMFKTPDALISGQSTVEVIKSCMPAIQDPWAMPSIDVDFCLIAIRIATYGDKMEISTECPHCKSDNNYDIDLQKWLQIYHGYQYHDVVDLDPLTVHIRPYNYKEITKTSIKALEQQKIFAIVNDDKMSDEDKIEKFGKSFVKITELTVDIIAECISKIETPNGSTTDKAQIKGFINNCDKIIFEKVAEAVNGNREKVELKPEHVKCGSCSGEYDVPVTMDQANFFAVGSRA
jgi:hypothetical protein